MARTKAPHNHERRPRRTGGRGERRTVAETVGHPFGLPLVLDLFLARQQPQGRHLRPSRVSSDHTDEMQSVLYRYYILMDLTNTAMRIIRNFNPDTDPAEIAGHFVDLRQVFQSAMSAEEFTELATRICLKTIELRDCGNSSHHVKLVRRACEYIQENYNSPDISLNTVAAHVALSPTHFSTIFSQEMSVTFIDHLTNVRMEKVKEMLASTDEKVVNIAFKWGTTSRIT